VPSEARRSGARPVGRFPLKDATFATAFALPFGQVDADTLMAFCTDVVESGAAEIRLAPGRGLIVPGSTAEACTPRIEAAALGFITDAEDPRLVIAACAGAPFCASAHFATRALGAEIARAAPELLPAARSTFRAARNAARSPLPPMSPFWEPMAAASSCRATDAPRRPRAPSHPKRPLPL
jgi:precorrin-3B synthase